MTLHEAIEKLLRQTNRPMTTVEIANELNKNNWYSKKDGSTIEPFQIHGRTRKYPNLFNRNGTTVSLCGQSGNIVKVSKQTIENKQTNSIETNMVKTSLENDLLNEEKFKSAAIVDNLIPDEPGLYCIRIIDENKLPKPFDSYLRERKHNIIYIGIASKSLRTRFLNQELRAVGHGTFFRSIGAVLGFRPEKGSLTGKANKRNYKFKQRDEVEIINWINSNLIVNWLTFTGNFEKEETVIIERNLPLMNLAKNPKALKELSELRAECVRIANT